MVQDVRCICPKLHTNQLRDLEVFAQRKVDHVEPGSDQTISAFVPKRADGWYGEGRGVVPATDGLITEAPVAHYIRELVPGQCFRVTRTHSDGEWLSAVGNDGSRGLESSENCIEDRVIVQEGSSSAKRQIINHASFDGMSLIEVGAAVICVSVKGILIDLRATPAAPTGRILIIKKV